MGDGKAGGRKRAVGTRDRVMAHLLMAGEVTDPSGLASTVLAEAVGYPGSSVAFAQLLSGMERSGLVKREVRGKRTYRITPVNAALAPARSAPVLPRGGKGGAREAAAAATDDFDYDELARRLLLQVVQRLGAEPGPGEDAVPGPAAGGGEPALARTVASLELKLASARSRQRRLTGENAKLREQLRAAQESLAQAQERAGAERIAGRLDSAEIDLLERLLSPLRDKGGRPEESGAG
ncbi:MAG TPA: hypothetical protein VGQ26_26110 [Streptosporangiaceae bacterium]|nr:hypothetical protein [Streptosporangiaceae bacterium]